MGLRMKNYAGSLKNPIFMGEFTKNQYIGEDKRGPWTACSFKRGPGKKEGRYF